MVQANPGIGLDSISDVATFADISYGYDSEGRIVSVTSQGNGCSICSAGLGVTTFDYTTNKALIYTITSGSTTTAPTFDVNTWTTKRMEYGPGSGAGQAG